MFDLKTLKGAVEQIAEEKNISIDQVLAAMEDAIAAAYKKEYNYRGSIVKAELDLKTGEVKFWQVKTVVNKEKVRIVSPEEEEEEKSSVEKKAENGDEEEKLPRYNPDRHIFLEEARKIKANVQPGEELIFPLESHSDFGRIAAQTAKQVILQKLQEAERNSIIEEYKDKEGEIVGGVVQRYERGNVYIDLGRAVGIMFFNESIPGEHYRSGDRLKFYVLAVQEETRVPGIILSRAHPKFVSQLFAMEVPEIADGTVEVKAIAREAGSRTKIALASNVEGVDPVGSAVGQRGTRVMAVSNELGQEKLDIVEWSEDPAVFVANALSPAKIKLVEILPRREARAFVAEDQLSLAIGKGGQNVRLAAKLTGWKIDVRSQENPEEVQASAEATGEVTAAASEKTEKEKTGGGPKKEKVPESEQKVSGEEKVNNKKSENNSD